MKHILIQPIDFSSLELHKNYKIWLKNWLLSIDQEIEDGNISSSLCLQAFIAEVLLYGKPKTDWEGVFDLYLKDEEGKPLAYSEKFGLRLFRFTGQWKQNPVHAIYTKYWIDKLVGKKDEINYFADLIESFIQPDGWIYNPKVSITQIRTRMKSEYLMSMAMGIEILKQANRLSDYNTALKATISDMPNTGYISAEYFRASALELLDSTKLVPTNLADIIHDCVAGKGYCDFSVKNKVDEYMGSAKRTSRDIALHSPLASCQASYLTRFIPVKDRNKVDNQLKDLRDHLISEPFDIPAFKIRDLPFPFGTDISPIEVICASWIISNKK